MAIFRSVPSRSQLTLVGRSSLHPIHASTTRLEWQLEAELRDGNQLDLSVTPHGRLEVAVESLKAGNELYDLAMRESLDLRRYPTIVAEVREMHPLNAERPYGGADRYRVVGDLSFHGVTRRVPGEIKIIWLNDRTIEVRGEQTFDIRDFGVTPPKLLLVRVYPDVRITLSAVAERVD